ncbi:alpha-1,2-fucosyltransferase [Pedobacter sp. B4-66]|uniref:alpha-1,2-fucosyltransferase n=1 Tax=Pedobacter sp. B4-66 TaxID=2817280 RepID=UPI001BDAFA73|nr:alpha-1,2-fucosyltransferase [Pedobacter sp. B4-66]
MIVVNLMGGLGNQMFQYAFAKYLSLRHNLPIYINASIYIEKSSNRPYSLENLNIGYHLIGDGSNLDIQVTEDDLVYINEGSFHFDNTSFGKLDYLESLNTKLIVLNGYWQSNKYFIANDDVIKNEFVPKKKLDDRGLILRNRIKSVNAVMINVRHGDYLTKLDYHGVVSESYLLSAIGFIASKVDRPHYFVFSDDLPWCREKLKHIDNLEFVGEEFYDEHFIAYFQLMMSCTHFINANSTFSWWASYLGQRDGSIVIYPKQWFVTQDLDIKDLIPETWIGFN